MCAACPAPKSGAFLETAARLTEPRKYGIMGRMLILLRTGVWNVEEKTGAAKIFTAANIISAIGVLFLAGIFVFSGCSARSEETRALRQEGYVVEELEAWRGGALPAADRFLTEAANGLVRSARYSIAPKDVDGEQNVEIALELSDGTARKESAKLLLKEPVAIWEIGTAATAESLLGEEFAGASFSPPLENFTEVGEYDVELRMGDKTLPCKLRVADTEPPVITLADPIVFSAGQRPKPQDVVASCEDVSEVEYHFSVEPDTSEATEEGKTQLIAVDAGGNSVTLDVVYSVTAPANTTTVTDGTEETGTTAAAETVTETASQTSETTAVGNE